MNSGPPCGPGVYPWGSDRHARPTPLPTWCSSNARGVCIWTGFGLWVWAWILAVGRVGRSGVGNCGIWVLAESGCWSWSGIWLLAAVWSLHCAGTWSVFWAVGELVLGSGMESALCRNVVRIFGTPIDGFWCHVRFESGSCDPKLRLSVSGLSRVLAVAWLANPPAISTHYAHTEHATRPRPSVTVAPLWA